MTGLDTSSRFAAEQDAADPLRGFRDAFHIPRHDGAEMAYFCGNSLGLQPKDARRHVDEVMDKWARDAVEAHVQDLLTDLGLTVASA
jgi:Kynureninase (EC 3.7.1.3)